MKRLLKRSLEFIGLDAYQLRRSLTFPAGSDQRPVGRMDTLLEDLVARGISCEAVMDVGANKTHWSKTAITFFPNAKFYLIEPQTEMENRLKSFCQKHKNAQYFLLGVGNEEEEKMMTIWDDLAGSSFMPQIDDKLLKQGKQRSVPVSTIDLLIEKESLKIPDLIKMDIQGYELKALQGAASTFGKTKAYILEVALYEFMDGIPVFNEVTTFMQERGYIIYDFGGFLRRPFDGALAYCDICFVQEKGSLRASSRW